MYAVFKETEEMYQRALTGYERGFGSDHIMVHESVKVLEPLSITAKRIMAKSS